MSTFCNGSVALTANGVICTVENSLSQSIKLRAGLITNNFLLRSIINELIIVVRSIIDELVIVVNT